MNEKKIIKILEIEDQHIRKLNEIVLKAVEEEKLISETIYDTEERNVSFKALIADKIALFGGSWMFITSFAFFIVVWIVSNVYLFFTPFDPYPFILLNLLLSTVAALQAPIIMMSQNRKEEKDRERAIHDYMINLKAEIEVRNLHQKLDLLIREQMKTLFEIQQIQMEMMDEIKNGLLKS